MRSEEKGELADIIFIGVQASGGLLLDDQGLHHAPIAPEDMQIIEANLRLYDASRFVQDSVASQYMRQAAEDRLRTHLARLRRSRIRAGTDSD